MLVKQSLMCGLDWVPLLHPLELAAAGSAVRYSVQQVQLAVAAAGFAVRCFVRQVQLAVAAAGSAGCF